MNTTLKIKEQGFINDHRLEGHCIVPATWYLEAMLSEYLKGSNLPLSLTEINYFKAMPVSNTTECDLEVRLDNGQCDVLIKTNDEWELCANSKILSPPIQVKQTIDAPIVIKDILKRCTQSYKKAAYYQLLKQKNYDFGLAHQGIKEVFMGKQEAIGRIELLPKLEPEKYLIHPAFLDACSQVALCLLPAIEKDKVFITRSQKLIHVYQTFPKTVWCYAIKTKQEENYCEIGLFIFDEDHVLLAEIVGYRLQSLSLSLLLQSEQPSFYNLEWQEEPLVDLVETMPKIDKIIIHQIDNPLALPIINIKDLSTTAIIVVLKQDEDIYSNNFTSLVFLLNIVQQLNAQNIIQLYRFVVVIHQEANLPIRQENLNLKNACVPGFCRALGQELPGLQVICLDVGLLGFQDALTLLDKELSCAFEENDIAYRLKTRYVLRLKPLLLTAQPMPSVYKLTYQKSDVLQDTAWVPLLKKMVVNDHEVEVKVAASSINFRDVLILLDQYPEKEAQLGIDGSGVITRIGSAVQKFKVGDEVMFISQHEFANHIIIPESSICKRPSHLHLVEAAVLPVVFITAFYALVILGQLKKGQTVLVHSATGGVGMAAILIAKKIGAKVHATAHPSKWKFLENLGVLDCHSSRDLQFSEDIPKKSVDLVLNNLIGDFVPKSLELIKKQGAFIEIGNKEVWSQDEMHSACPDVAYHLLHVLHVQEEDPLAFQEIFLKMRDFIELHRLHAPAFKAYAAKDIQVAFKDIINAKHLGKCVVKHEHFHATSFQGGCYLITGGLGGIGLELAHFLLQNQASQVFLMNRHVPEYLPQDPRIEVLIGDVAEEKDLIDVLTKISKSPAPLKGIFHAAGISQDKYIQDLEPGDIKEVLQAKLRGAWCLHEHSQHLNLDYFVLFSSVASLLGTPGLSNYAAANGFLDSLANYRRFKGLPGLSIHWGPWEVGMLQKRDPGVRKSWQTQGFSILDAKRGLAYFRQALLNGESEIAIMPVDWQTLISYYRQAQVPSLLKDLLPQTIQGKPKTQADSGLVQSLTQSTEGDRRQLLMNYVRQEIETLTGEKVTNFNLSFTEMGITSLTAIQLTKKIGNTLGLNLAQTVLFNYSRLSLLSDHLLTKLYKIDKPNYIRQSEHEKQKNSTPAPLMALDNLTDREVVDLLEDALKDIDDLL